MAMIYEGFDINSAYDYKVEKLLAEIAASNCNVRLYGCGIQARTAILLLTKLGLGEKISLYDSNKSKTGASFCGYQVNHTSELDDLPNSTVLITCCFPDQVFKSLDARHTIYSILPLYKQNVSTISESDLDSTGLNYSRSMSDMGREMQLYENELLAFKSKLSPSLLNLKSIDAVVTEGCSLKCEDCSNLMQYYVKPKSVDLDVLVKSTQKILDSVDHVYEWRILGGEPLIYRHLAEYLCYLSSSDKINSILIYTNGTMLPNAELIAALKTSKAFLDVSNYQTLSRNIQKLSQICDQNSIPYAIKDPLWTDSGRIHPHKNESESELKTKFFNCCTKDVLTLLHGKLYHCPFSANLINLDEKYQHVNDVIDVINYAGLPETLRADISSFYISKPYLDACNYCNGRDYTVPIIPTAIQTRKPLPLP